MPLTAAPTPTILTLPATPAPPIPAPTSPTTCSFFADRWSRAGPRKRWLIYFVTGNPGLIAYYDLFLSHLHFLLGAHPTLAPGNAFEVFGRSLSGFEGRGAGVEGGVWPAGVRARKRQDGGATGEAEMGTGKPPFGLVEQIDGVEWALWDHVKGMGEVDERGGARTGGGGSDGGDDGDEPRIIVIGHSVGAYMALEVVKRWRESLKRKKRAAAVAVQQQQKPVAANVGEKRAESGDVAAPPSASPADAVFDDDRDGGRIVGAVCLFPTVTHIAKSSSGLKLGPPDAAAATAAFLKSPHGVRQALHMARDELQLITHDAWDADIWGAAEQSPVGVARAKLFFLFGAKDHWVGDEGRDELIKTRARGGGKSGRGGAKGAEKWKPVMEIDKAGIPHGFCVGEFSTAFCSCLSSFAPDPDDDDDDDSSFTCEVEE
ncbi:hypothetical protein MPH_06607 [Macrophomina phaseolina MS6]|uniref:Uncharacterized protein n=1 Tax=Macrophomina phaseolina (strain MS6) TaxID=1126212 RepID=K2SH48_MACPH|nr:hypothetical protein MPH_06607 [Macrophomina phaseolina MS6]